MQGETEQVSLPVEGMGCGGCAAKVEKLLRQSAGVCEAVVSFPRAEAVVTYDPALTGSAQLTAMLSEAGYSVPTGG